MDLLKIIDTNLFSLVLLGIVLHYINREGKNNNEIVYFKHLIYANLLLLILSTITWIVDGGNETINYISSWLLIVLNPLPFVTWFSYIDYKAFRDKPKLRKRQKIYALPLIIYMILGIVQFFTPILFKIEASHYGRGYGYNHATMVIYLAFILYLVYIYLHRDQMTKRLLRTNMAFSLIPMVIILVQLLDHGISLIWPAFSLLVLYAFINIERKELLKDTLTGLVTRGQFEHQLDTKLKQDQPFTIIKMNLDGFKIINATYGYDEGDETLKVFSNNIQRVVKAMDTVCRYGGDEFIILLESKASETGEVVLNRINESLAIFNSKPLKTYDINFSSGLLYINNKQSLLEVLTEVDKRMYQDKNERRK
jgi:diguanylate cyclase (GGDEF)-like protein